MPTTKSKKVNIRKSKIKLAPIIPQTVPMKALLDGISLKDAASDTARPWNSFEEWVKEFQTIKNPDRARTALYYGFQPLYDAILEERVPASSRPDAVKALDLIMQGSVRFLSGYYLGRPDMAGVDALAAEIAPRVSALKAEFRVKDRNVDRNGIYPDDILSFLRQFAEHFHSAQPQMVVACACGSSEIAMPLAGLLGVPLAFMRRSHRRGDDMPKIIKEHLPALKSVKGLEVVCVEDYVCTGGSLQRVMEKTKALGAKKVWGAAVTTALDSSLRIVSKATRHQKFYLFELK